MIASLPLAGAAACAAGLLVTTVRAEVSRRRDTRWAARVADVTGPFHPAGAGATAPTLASSPGASAGASALPRKLLGWRAERRAHYAMHWSVMLLLCSAPAALATWLGSLLLGRLAWLAAPALCVFLCRRGLAIFADHVSARLLAQFPDALSAIARAVRIGVPLGESVRLVARDSLSPTREEFARAADQTMIGLPLENALREMAERTEVAEYRFFATALALQAQTGGALTETLDNLGDTIRKRRAAARRAHALASEARASTYVLAALPIVVGALLALMNPDYVGMLFTDPGGRKLLAYACFSLIGGLLVMRQIIARSLS